VRQLVCSWLAFHFALLAPAGALRQHGEAEYVVLFTTHAGKIV
jgi:hypothetical protein